jgi:hypothetical protein
MTYNKLVLLHDYISKETQLIESFKEDCKVIQTTNETKLDDILGQIQEFKNSDGKYPFNHLTFVYHFPGYHSVPFLDNIKQDLCGNLLDNKYHYFNDEIIDLIKELGNKLTVDLLSCNLKDNKFKEEVEKIESDLNINIRYSVDQTGNNPQGNWVLESDDVNIKELYFNETIDQWDGVLSSERTISDVAIALPTYFSLNGNTLTLLQNFDWSNFTVDNLSTTDYIKLDADQVFDGQGHTIDLENITEFEGLFSFNNDNDITYIDNSPLIKNLGVLNGTTSENGGFIVRKQQKKFRVDNCYSTGTINKNGGGICGQGIGSYGGYCIITNCYSTGTIKMNGGGITGDFTAGGKNGNCRIDSCYSTGNIIEENSGGITGQGSGAFGGYCIISNCYSIGNIINDYCGGISGHHTGYAGSCSIRNSYYSGIIDSLYTSTSGGIVGSNIDSSNNSICSISNTYSNYVTTENSLVIDRTNTSNNKLDGNFKLSNISNNLTVENLGDDYIVSFLDNYEYPLLKSILLNKLSSLVINNNTLILKESLSFDTLKMQMNSIHNTNNFTHFVLSDNQIFDGQDHTINLGSNYTFGLFASTGTSIENGPLIKNLGVLNGILGYLGGYIVRKEQTYFKIDNCYSTGELINTCGGICGSNIGKNGICNITNCYSTGNITGTGCGCICGSNTGISGICNITNCYSTGNIPGAYSGGICGSYSGNNGQCNITNCYSTGNIIGTDCGGICGYRTGLNGGTCNINNCYYSGNITGNYTGGICSSYTSGICIIRNSYTINGRIISSIHSTGNVTVENCYSAFGGTGNTRLNGNYLLSDISNNSGIGNLGDGYTVSFLNNYNYPVLKSNLGAGLITSTELYILLNKNVNFSNLQNALNHNTNNNFTHFIPNQGQNIINNGNNIILNDSNNTDILTNKEILDIYNLKILGYTVSQLENNGYTASQLKNAGFKSSDVINNLYTVNELKEAGYRTHKIYQAGYPASQFLDGLSGINLVNELKKLRANNYSLNSIESSINSSISISRDNYIQAGYSVAELDEENI